MARYEKHVVVLCRHCLHECVAVRGLYLDFYSATVRETYDADELPFTKLDNTMCDQHAYTIKRVWDEYDGDQDARHYEN